MQIVKIGKYREVIYHILDTPEWVWANKLCRRRVRVGTTSKVYSLALNTADCATLWRRVISLQHLMHQTFNPKQKHKQTFTLQKGTLRTP